MHCFTMILCVDRSMLFLIRFDQISAVPVIVGEVAISVDVSNYSYIM